MKIYVNGDSYAWGAELENPEQDRFSRLISNQFGCEEINQSICGNSNHIIFATTKKWIENNDTTDTYFIIVLTDFLLFYAIGCDDCNTSPYDESIPDLF